MILYKNIIIIVILHKNITLYHYLLSATLHFMIGANGGIIFQSAKREWWYYISICQNVVVSSYGRLSPAIVDCCVYFSHPRVMFHMVFHTLHSLFLLLH